MGLPRAYVDEATVDEAMVDEAMVDEATVDEAMVDEAMVDEAMVDEAMVDEAMVDEAMVDEAIVDEAMVDEAMVDEALSGKATCCMPQAQINFIIKAAIKRATPQMPKVAPLLLNARRIATLPMEANIPLISFKYSSKSSITRCL